MLLYNILCDDCGCLRVVHLRPHIIGLVEPPPSPRYLSCCRFVNDKEIITSSGDSTCIQWDLTKQEPKNCFDDHTGDVMSISINPKDDRVFASASCDMSVKVWDVRTAGKKPVNTFEGSNSDTGHESDINSVDFMSNGTSIATGSDDSTCKLFDLRSYCLIASYASDNIVTGITSVALSKGGRVLFAGYDDANCRPWDTITTEAIPTNNNSTFQHDNRVSCLGVNSSGQALATGSWDMLLKIWA